VLTSSLFLELKVFLDVFKDCKTTRFDELIKRKRIFSVVDFSLQHWVEIFYVDIRIFDQCICCFRNEYYLYSFVDLQKQDVYYLKDKLRLNWHQNL
jgi:hypothetical protein